MSLVPRLVGSFAVLSLLSIGGINATVPEIHRQVVETHHWMSDITFAQLIAVGQTAPGPNVLIVSMIGWRLAGLAGLLAATAAIVVPSCLLAFAVARIVAGRGRLVAELRGALAPIAVGFMLASGVVMTRAAYQGMISLGIVAAVAAMVATSRISPVWGIAGGAAIGLVQRHLHLVA